MSARPEAPPRIQLPCPHCDGEGDVWSPDRHASLDCPGCGGTGTVLLRATLSARAWLVASATPQELLARLRETAALAEADLAHGDAGDYQRGLCAGEALALRAAADALEQALRPPPPPRRAARSSSFAAA